MCTLGLINERASLQIQCLLICIEMLLASIAHFYIFPYNEWYPFSMLFVHGRCNTVYSTIGKMTISESVRRGYCFGIL